MLVGPLVTTGVGDSMVVVLVAVTPEASGVADMRQASVADTSEAVALGRRT
jgi:hypothetical protein